MTQVNLELGLATCCIEVEKLGHEAVSLKNHPWRIGGDDAADREAACLVVSKSRVPP